MLFFFNIKRIENFLISPHLMEGWIQQVLLLTCNSNLRKSTMHQWWQLMVDTWLEHGVFSRKWREFCQTGAPMLHLHWLHHLSPFPLLPWEHLLPSHYDFFRERLTLRLFVLNLPFFKCREVIFYTVQLMQSWSLYCNIVNSVWSDLFNVLLSNSSGVHRESRGHETRLWSLSD